MDYFSPISLLKPLPICKFGGYSQHPSRHWMASTDCCPWLWDSGGWLVCFQDMYLYIYLGKKIFQYSSTCVGVRPEFFGPDYLLHGGYFISQKYILL